MMTEYHRAADSDPYAGKGDCFVSKEGFAGEHGYYLAYDAEARQGEDIGCRVRVKPEHVLVKQGLASACGAEERHVQSPFKQDEQQGHGHELCEEERQYGGGDGSPYEYRHAEDAHARGAQLYHGRQDVDGAEYRRKACEVGADQHEVHPEGLVGDGKRRVYGPARIESPRPEGCHHQYARCRHEPERERVQPRERHVLRTYLERHEVIHEPGESGYGYDEKHHDAVVADERGIGLGVQAEPDFGKVRPRDQLERHRYGQEYQGGRQVLDADGFMVGADTQETSPGTRRHIRFEPVACADEPPCPVVEKAERDKVAGNAGDDAGGPDLPLVPRG